MVCSLNQFFWQFFAMSYNHCLINHTLNQFLDASPHLYKRVCPYVRPYVRPSVRNAFSKIVIYLSGTHLLVNYWPCLLFYRYEKECKFYPFFLHSLWVATLRHMWIAYLRTKVDIYSIMAIQNLRSRAFMELMWRGTNNLSAFFGK